MKMIISSASAVLVNLLLLLQCLSLVSFAQDFDFFYFVLQWPGAYCDTAKQHSCCYPKSGKPAADFGIHGLWPNYKSGSYPQNCDPDAVFDKSEISEILGRLEKQWPTLACPSGDGTKFWAHEWEKHGTCAESELDQRQYFETALKLKDKINLLQVLGNAGIKPDDRFYGVDEMKDAVKAAVGFTPWVECNVDASRNSQLYQVYFCVDTSGSDLIDCPVNPGTRNCHSRIQFPKF